MLAVGLPVLVGAGPGGTGQPASDALLEQALESAKQSSSPFERSQRIAAIALLQAQRGDIAAALANARSVEEFAFEQSDLMRKIVALLADSGDFAAALDAARSVRSSAAYGELLARIAQAQALAGQVAAAIDTAKSIAAPDGFSDAILQIVVAQARSGDVAGAQATARGAGYDRENRQATLGVALAQAIGGDLEGAIKAAASLGKGDEAKRAFTRIASELFDMRDFDHALFVLDRLRDLDAGSASPWLGDDGTRMLIAITMAQDGDRKRGDGVAATIRDNGHRAVALANIAAFHSQAGDNAAARADAGAAMDAALAATDFFMHRVAPQRAAEAAGLVGEIDRVIVFAKTAANGDNPVILSDVLSAAARGAARNGDSEGVAAIVKAAGDSSKFLVVCPVMVEAANGYAATGAIDPARQMVRQLKEASCAPFDEVALASIAAAQAQQGDIAGALATADQIVGLPEYRAQALTEIASTRGSP